MKKMSTKTDILVRVDLPDSTKYNPHFVEFMVRGAPNERSAIREALKAARNKGYQATTAYVESMPMHRPPKTDEYKFSNPSQRAPLSPSLRSYYVDLIKGGPVPYRGMTIQKKYGRPYEVFHKGRLVTSGTDIIEVFAYADDYIESAHRRGVGNPVDSSPELEVAKYFQKHGDKSGRARWL